MVSLSFQSISDFKNLIENDVIIIIAIVRLNDNNDIKVI